MSSTPKQTDTTQTTKVELPAWVDQGGQDNYALAQQIASQPYQQVSGPLTAGMNNSYRNAAYGNMYAGEDTLAGAAMTATNDANSAVANAPANVSLNGYTPLTVNAQQVAAPTSVKDIFAANIGQDQINKYMNPYENDVVQGAQTAGQQSIDASQRANSDAAIAAGAFGSSRHGVTEGVTAAQGAQDIANTVGQIRSAGFNTALSAAQSDASRTDAMSQANQNKDMTFQDLLSRVGMANQSADLSAQTSNQGALQSRAQMQLSADQGNQSTSSALINQRLQAAGLGLSAGQAMSDYSKYEAGTLGADAMNAQQTQQAGLDRVNAQKQAQIDYPTQQLNLRLAALGMTPYGKTTSSTGSSTESGGDNPFLTAIGGLTSMKGLFPFSDPKLKKNAKPIGKGPNDLTVHEFEYRQDKGVNLPKGKQIGFMADEVKKKVPSAVHRQSIGHGKTAMAVDYDRATTPGLFGFGKRKKAA